MSTRSNGSVVDFGRNSLPMRDNDTENSLRSQLIGRGSSVGNRFGALTLEKGWGSKWRYGKKVFGPAFWDGESEP